MAKHFLQYWRPEQVDYNFEIDPTLNHTASGQFHRVSEDDVIWIVTIRPQGKLSLVGRIEVSKVTRQAEAERLIGMPLYKAAYHAIAKDGTVEIQCETVISGLAARLRFASAKDRLTVVNGRVDGKQLQAIRELTPDSALLLEETWRGQKGGRIKSPRTGTQRGVSFEEAERIAWENASDLIAGAESEPTEQLIKSGGGFGNPETNKKVERAAISHVRRRYESDGWKVTSVESEKRGYDLLCSKGARSEHVEVKGVQGTIPSFIVTANEVKQARNDAAFVLCVVTSALSDVPRLHRFSGREFISRYDLAPLAYRAIPKQ
jgi:hypothetical protein